MAPGPSGRTQVRVRRTRALGKRVSGAMQQKDAHLTPSGLRRWPAKLVLYKRFARMAIGRRGLLAGPVRGGRLKHAKFVAVRVGHDVPAPSVFGDRLLSEHPGAQADEPAGLRLKLAGAQIEMNPVLGLLGLRNPLQEDLRALAMGGQEALIAASGHAVPDVAEHGGPELG